MKRDLFSSLHNLSLRIRPYFNLPLIQVTPPTAANPNPSPATGMVYTGNVPDLAAFAAMLSNIANNAGSAATPINFQTSAAATITLTGTAALFQRLTNGGATTVTLDSAYNMVLQIPGAFNGMQWAFYIAATGATTVATPTLSTTDVTLSGTTTVLAAAMRCYAAQITQLTTNVVMPLTAGSTFTSIAQVGSTNGFTVTLGTNALVPVVGTLFPITVTAGTLPSGFYPISKVTSATSFIISTPAGTVWTATAATLVGPTATAPQTYSPLLTVTGAWATATAIITV